MRATVRTLEVVAVISFFCLAASASPILLNLPTSQPTNAGDPAISTWLIQAVDDYNTAHGTMFATSSIGSTPDVKVNSGDTAPPGYPSFGSGTLSIILPLYLNDYLVLHWGGPDGGTFFAYDLTALPSTFDTFTAPGLNGLSSYAFYGSVVTSSAPEPATTVLIGVGLAALGIRRRVVASM